MAHLQDIQLIEYCNGQLSTAARSEVDAHLAECELCAEKLRQTRLTWEVLGGWEADEGKVDLTSRVLDRLEAEQADTPDAGPFRLQDWVWPVAKLAACVGLAAVIGHAAGLAVRPAPQAMTVDAADPQQAANELYLDIITDNDPTGLVSVILPPETTDTPDFQDASEAPEEEV